MGTAPRLFVLSDCTANIDEIRTMADHILTVRAAGGHVATAL